MKQIKQDAAAPAQSVAVIPETMQINDMPVRTALEARTLAMWQALHEYAASLTALSAEGLVETEVQKRRAECMSRRMHFLAAMDALQACTGQQDALGGAAS